MPPTTRDIVYDIAIHLAAALDRLGPANRTDEMLGRHVQGEVLEVAFGMIHQLLVDMADEDERIEDVADWVSVECAARAGQEDDFDATLYRACLMDAALHPSEIEVLAVAAGQVGGAENLPPHAVALAAEVALLIAARDKADAVEVLFAAGEDLTPAAA